MRKLPTVTVASPAHNEQANIGNYLNSVFKQNQKNFVLERIIIACDGCTDNTYQIVTEIAKSHTEMIIMSDGLGLGKVARSNQFFKMNRSDILVCMDSDVYLKSKTVLEEIVKVFAEPNVGLVGGHDTPAPGKTFVQKLAVTGARFWEKARHKVNKGSSVLNHHGGISCLSREFAKKAYIIPDIVADDIYLYYLAISLGFKFRFAPKATVYFATPSTMSDYLLQMSRYKSQLSRVAPYFPQVYKDHKISPWIKFIAYLEMFVEEPLFFPLVIPFQIFTRLAVKFNHQEFKDGKWQVSMTTKNQAIRV